MRYALALAWAYLSYAAALHVPLASRRDVLAAAASSAVLALPRCANAESLEQRIQARHFEKPLFSLPPKEARYPVWMEGTWDVTAGFGGYLFPNKKVEKEAVVGE
jgi:hypothetical protein